MKKNYLFLLLLLSFIDFYMKKQLQVATCYREELKEKNYKRTSTTGTQQAIFVGAMIVSDSSVEFRHSQASAKAACFVTYTIWKEKTS